MRPLGDPQENYLRTRRLILDPRSICDFVNAPRVRVSENAQFLVPCFKMVSRSTILEISVYRCRSAALAAARARSAIFCSLLDQAQLNQRDYSVA